MIAKQEQGFNKTLLIATIIIVALLVILYCYRCSTTKHTTSETGRTTVAIEKVEALELPENSKGNEEVYHKAYTISFNPQYKEASWVAYKLTGEHMGNANELRTNTFTQDPLLHSAEATDEDYSRSGYDRGHLAPAEDMAWSKETMQECFYYSNMAPQKPDFNRGVWKRLEELVRYWSQAYDSVFIVTGPVLTSGLPTLGPNKIAIPQLFYKVVLEYRQNEIKGIGFVLPNEASVATLRSFAVSIDSVEHLTGINFFPRLDDAIEEKIESNPQVDEWLWQRKKSKGSR